MSLLDDVSIVVTPNGYKAGELYAVIPVPTEGAEEVTSFTNGTTYPFTTFATSGNNITSAIVSSAFAGAASNGISVTSGEIYKVTFDYTKNSGDDLRVLFAVSANGAASAISNNVIISASGTYTEYFTITSTTTGYLQMGTGNSGHSLNASITNVSVKEYTSADMDVTRATAATRVDENGLVNYAQVISDTDLVTNGDFATDTDWSKDASWTIANGKASYDGSGNGHRIKQNIPLTIGKTYTASLDILDSSGNFRISVDGGTASYANYTSGDGTYTFEFTSSSVEFSIRASMGYGADTISVDNVSVKEVTRDNVPRIDYTGGGCPHILAEPQRTNLITYSEDFSQWLIYDTITRTANYGTSPDGTQNSFEIGSSGASNDFMYLSLSISASQSHSLSFFIKNVDSVESKFFTPSESTTTITWSGSGITSISDGTYESFGNGWYKITSTATSQSDGGYISRFYPSTSGTASVELYGYQVEEGSYATSYIPTSGSTVTRNQDIFTRGGIGNLINSTEGVLFVEMAALSDDGTFRYVSLTDGTGSNCIRLYYTTTSNSITYQVRFGGSLEVLSTVAVSDTTNFNKIAVKWKLNDFAMWIGGVEVATDTSGQTPLGMNRLGFDSSGGGGPLYGKVKQLQVYKTALTDTQLAALTS